MTRPVLAVHGGAGAVHQDGALEALARRGLGLALDAGRRALADGGGALDAVVEAVVVLEDCEAFNAGRGSVLNEDGEVEMDAAVMEGREGRAGAVACVRDIAHPILAARSVMEHSAHVLLSGAGAERFARDRGLEQADPASLVTPRRRAQLERARNRGEPQTVGAVARDARGGLAAATSTGGMTAKLAGRVSDSCLVGAGTWADDATCAISATGHGELFIRCAFAHEVDAAMRLGGRALDAACEHAMKRLARIGGHGGCIAVDAAGHLALPFDTPAMPRGWMEPDGTLHVVVHEAPV